MGSVGEGGIIYQKKEVDFDLFFGIVRVFYDRKIYYMLLFLDEAGDT